MSTQRTAREQLAAEQAAARRRERRILLLVVGALVLAVVGGGIAFQAWRTGRAPVPAQISSAGGATPATSAGGASPSSTSAGGASPSSTSAAAAVTPGRPLLFGAPGAPTTVTLYEDFHCPHCADFNAEYGGQLHDAIAAGRVKVELYPMAFIDDGSAAASNAVACAAEAGFGQAYWEGLFANHALRWSDQQLISLAGSAGDGFAQCVTSDRHRGWVDSINDAAEANGVQATPTMLVDGKTVDLASLTSDKLGQLLSGGSR